LRKVDARPFALTLDGAGTFPDPSRARVLYQSVTGGSAELTALSRRVRTAAERVAVPSDNAKHVPHLTLARTRRPAPLTRWLTIVGSFPALTFEVAEFVLVHSDLHPSGPEYRVLQRVPLHGRPHTD
jgi:2'-5' RNA ligase